MDQRSDLLVLFWEFLVRGERIHAIIVWVMIKLGVDLGNGLYIKI